jgi:hypothetical protein
MENLATYFLSPEYIYGVFWSRMGVVFLATGAVVLAGGGMGFEGGKCGRYTFSILVGIRVKAWACPERSATVTVITPRVINFMNSPIKNRRQTRFFA